MDYEYYVDSLDRFYLVDKLRNALKQGIYAEQEFLIKKYLGNYDNPQYCLGMTDLKRLLDYINGDVSFYNKHSNGTYVLSKEDLLMLSNHSGGIVKYVCRFSLAYSKTLDFDDNLIRGIPTFL